MPDLKLKKLAGFLKPTIKNLAEPVINPPEPGLYHYSYQENGGSCQVHLRVDADGSGILLINASRLFHLNPTALFFAFLTLQGASEKQAVKSIKLAYQVPDHQARKDFLQISSQIKELIRPNATCPLHDFDIDVQAPFSVLPSAPYRMDLAITYRCNNNCSHCYNDRPRSYPELTTEEWFEILDKLWKIGIPHVVFTGGEPTLRNDLPDLIARAQRNGQITGLNTNGRWLSDWSFLNKLKSAGLDHIQITLESHDKFIHDEMVNSRGAWEQTVQGLKNALQTNFYVMTNTTLLKDNSHRLGETLDFLGELGVPTVGLNALIYSGRGLTVGKGLAETELSELLAVAVQKTNEYGQRLIWYTPTQYCQFDPMQLELGVKGCTAALYNMCIESNGDVIPCQSYYQSLGNILKDSWETIWNHELCNTLRYRKYIQEKCQGCALLAECGGGCPLSYPAG